MNTLNAKTKNTKTKLLIGLTLLTAGLCSGCSSNEEAAQKAAENTTVKRCWDTGGMPVRSIWDNRFVDCVYPASKGA